MQYAEIFDKKVFELAKRIAEKNPEPFIALEEYDKTRKLKKWGNKVRVNFTLDRGTVSLLRGYSNETGIKMSTLIEQLINEKVKKTGKNK